MTSENLSPVLSDQAPRFGRGLIALLLTGGALLAASGYAGRQYWAPAPTPAPQIWMGAFTPAAPPTGFASGVGETPLPAFPRVVLQRQPVVAVADVQPAPTPALEPAPQIALPAVAVVSEGPGEASPGLTFGPPPMLPPRRPGGVLAGGVLAPSLALMEVAPVDAAMSRSRLPRPRPALVARLAVDPAELTRAIPAAETQHFAVAATPGADHCSAAARAVPSRPSGAPGGQAVLAPLANAGGSARDNAIAQALMGGNLPDFLRQLVPVGFSGTVQGQAVRITLCVTPDYLAVGSNADFVRVPLGLPAAARVAERFEMLLPTARMVDVIHAQAQVRLAPQPMTPGAEMATTGYFLRHNATLEGQRQAAGGRLGMLVSGHKKDLVLSNRLERNRGRVAIYGWHRASGQPIQPLSTVHGAAYADYSHGVRLVSRRAYLNGRAVDLRELLADARYAALISDEGPIAPGLAVALASR